MKVTIDREGCISCGLCASTCPGVFMMDSDTKASILEDFREDGPEAGEIPDSQRDCAQAAADGCPVSVIQVS